MALRFFQRDSATCATVRDMKRLICAAMVVSVPVAIVAHALGINAVAAVAIADLAFIAGAVGASGFGRDNSGHRGMIAGHANHAP